MNKLLSIKEASKLLGVSESTLRRWEREKKLIPDERTKGNQRRYRLSSIRPEMVQKLSIVLFELYFSCEVEEMRILLTL